MPSLGIIAIQILQVMEVYSFLQRLVTWNTNKNPVPTKPESESSHLDLADLADLIAMLIVKNSIGIKSIFNFDMVTDQFSSKERTQFPMRCVYRLSLNRGLSST